MNPTLARYFPAAYDRCEHGMPRDHACARCLQAISDAAHAGDVTGGAE